MRKIKFSSLSIKNFRNINELEINFNDTTTEIMGKNGLGKTNTLSAIMWCIFGKDINDNKLFTISPIIDNVEDNSINTVVKMVINDSYVIERSYNKRVTSLKTGYIIDGKEQLVSVTQTQFKQELLENLVDEETFKSLSNINYVPNLNWKDLKKLIFDLIGDIKDEEILLRDDFKEIEELITKFGIEQTQKLLNDTDKELNDDIKRLETEYQTLINTQEKYVASSEENASLEKRKKEIEDILYSSQEKQQELSKLINEYNEKKYNVSNLENEVNRIKNDIEFNKSNISDYNKLYEQNGFDVEIVRKREIDSKQYEINKSLNKITEFKSDIERYNNQFEEIKSKGNSIKNKEIKVENSTCSSCGQTLPNDKIEATLNKLKEQQNNDLNDLKTQYDNIKTVIEIRKTELEKEENNLKTLNSELESIKTKVYEVVDESDKQKQIRVARENKEIENKNLEKSLESKQQLLASTKEEFSKLVEPTAIFDNNSALKLELDDINTKLATTITLQKISEDVEKTFKNLDDKKNNKVTNKSKIQQAIKFNNIKADLLRQKVRSYFQIVEFKTKEYTVDGVEQETFKICNDKGIEWKDINTGHKILLGIDLLQGIMKAKDIYVPLLIDNGETVTNDILVQNTQLIIAKAVKGKESLEVK